MALAEQFGYLHLLRCREKQLCLRPLLVICETVGLPGSNHRHPTPRKPQIFMHKEPLGVLKQQAYPKAPTAYQAAAKNGDPAAEGPSPVALHNTQSLPTKHDQQHTGTMKTTWSNMLQLRWCVVCHASRLCPGRPTPYWHVPSHDVPKHAMHLHMQALWRAARGRTVPPAL